MLQVWVGCWFRLDVFAKVISHPQEKEKVSSRNRRCCVHRSLPVSSREVEPIQTTRVRPCYMCFLFLFLCSITICRLHKIPVQTTARSLCNWQLVFAIWCKDFNRSVLAGDRKNVSIAARTRFRRPWLLLRPDCRSFATPGRDDFYLRLVYTGLGSHLSCDLEFQVRWSQV
jgi:hypothetical protein